MAPVRTMRLVAASPPDRTKLPVAPTGRAASEAKVTVWAAPTWVERMMPSPPAKLRAPSEAEVPEARATSKAEVPARVTALACGKAPARRSVPWRTAYALVPRLLAAESVNVPLPTLVRPPAPRIGPEKSTSLPAVLSSVAVTKVDRRANVIGASKRSWELVFALKLSALAASPSEALELTAREPRLTWTVPRKVLAPDRR